MRPRPTTARLGLLLALLAAACDGDSTGPESAGYRVAIQAGDGQFARPGDYLAEPLSIVVTEIGSGDPADGVSVRWTLVEGSGAQISVPSSRTDGQGVARTQLRLGSSLGTYQVRAVVEEGKSTGQPVFSARAVLAPRVTGIAPEAPTAGSTVTISGHDFGAAPGDNTVSFGGVPAEVVAASATELRAVVPACMPTRTVGLVVQLGPVQSDPVAVQLQRGAAPAPLHMTPGSMAAVSDPALLGCLRLALQDQDAEYLVVLQSAADQFWHQTPFQLVGLAEPGALAASGFTLRSAALEAAPARQAPVGVEYEGRIRLREQSLSPDSAIRAGEPGMAGLVQPPKVGDRREFNVLEREGTFEKVTAVVRYVSERAVLYQDVDAPSGGFTDADFARFGSLFDDPIYATGVSAFGAPSDVDGNGRITILFSPVVNGWTQRGSGSFFAGFFYALDLTRQSGSNRGEIFYSLVPDPQGEFSDARSASQVLSVVPPVLAHEFQHMIHANQRLLLRKVAQETLWLSEALAHVAEDLVADVFEERGEAALAAQFRQGNLLRAEEYLGSPAGVSLVSAVSPGTLGERGMSWLFLRYLMGQYGDTDLLRRLTQTTRSGVANVTAETGQEWSDLLLRATVAFWADDAPALAGTAIDPRLQIPGVDLWSAFSRFGFPLQPTRLAYGDFLRLGELPASSAAYLVLEGDAASAASLLDLSLAPELGQPAAADARLQLSILRIR